MMQPEKTFASTAASLARQSQTIFDAPGFILVCTKCEKTCKLEDAIDKDFGCESDPCYQIKAKCPHCGMEADL